MLGLYARCLARAPIATQSAATAVLFGAGDIIAQDVMEKQQQQHDWVRTLRLCAFGGLISGPVGSRWYRFLEHKVPQTAQRGPAATLLARVALDQLLYAPSFIAVFFVAQSAMEGKTSREIEEKLRLTYIPAVVANWAVWPAVQAVNFRFVPVDHRLLVVNVVALAWNTFLSVLNAQGNDTIEEEERAGLLPRGTEGS